MARRLQRVQSCVATRAAHRHFRLQYVVVQHSMLRVRSCLSAMSVARLMYSGQVSIVVSVVVWWLSCK